MISKRYQQLVYWTTIGLDSLRSKSESVHIHGHPRSGTVWVTELISEYLQIPRWRLGWERTPTLEPRIFHIHRFLPFQNSDKRTVYVIRDGRDVLVSYYFAVLRNPETCHRQIRKIERHLKRPMLETNIEENLPAFIRYLENSRESSVDYVSHVRQAEERSFQVVKYEELLTRSEATFSSLLRRLQGCEPDRERVRRALKKHHLQRDPQGNPVADWRARTARAGDWRNYFTPTTADAYAQYAGAILIQLGYEKDDTWPDQLT